jgi:hypothetical protein
MPSTDRKLELKANNDGSDHLTAVGICQGVKGDFTLIDTNEYEYKKHE